MMKKSFTSTEMRAIALCVIALIALSVSVCICTASPVGASQKELQTTDYKAVYDKLPAESAEGAAAFQQKLDEMTLELEQAYENADQLQANLDRALAERDQFQQKSASLIEQYGTQYVVVFEVRRNVVFPASEETIRITVPMSREDFAQFQESQEVTQMLTCLSVPSDSFNVDWSIFVADTYIAAIDISE